MNAHNDINSMSRTNYSLDRVIDNTNNLNPQNKVFFGSQEVEITHINNDTMVISNGNNPIIGFSVYSATGIVTIEFANSSFTIGTDKTYSVNPLFDFNQNCWMPIFKEISITTGDDAIVTIYKPQRLSYEYIYVPK